MSVISQVAIVALIIITGVILLYANKGLADAAAEGEHFVDEWAMRQKRERENLKRNPFYHHNELMENYVQEEVQEESGDYGTDSRIRWDMSEDIDKEEKEIIKMDENCKLPDNLIPFRKTPTGEYDLILLDDQKNRIETKTVDHFPFSIGRDPKNDIVLNDLYVARNHCHIMNEQGMIVLKDLDSANKIFANGEIVNELILNDGQHFYVGGCEFLVEEKSHGSKPTILAAR